MLIDVLLGLRDSPDSIPSMDLRGTEFFVSIKKSGNGLHCSITHPTAPFIHPLLQLQIKN